ncbi:MAG: outer membrane protein transport protein, partial [Holophaga sp.]|nr:outer membrane protein transport protein [Holophaga sp.]
MKSRYQHAITATLALLVAGAFAPHAQASGFQLREQSPSAQGNAFAGVSAKGFDISSMFFNPATMTQFEGFQIVAGFSYVAPKAELNNGSATRASYSGPLAPFAAFGGTTINGPAS